MDDERETDEELIRRHAHVKGKFGKAKVLAERCKSPATRTSKMMWAGSLNFTLIGIESEMEERGLDTGKSIS